MPPYVAPSLPWWVYASLPVHHPVYPRVHHATLLTGIPLGTLQHRGRRAER